jgi:hypothetical protein
MPPSQPISAGEFANPCPRGRCLARSWGSGLGRSLLRKFFRGLKKLLKSCKQFELLTLVHCTLGSPRPMACDHPKRGPRGCRASLDLLRTTHGLRRGEIWAASIGRRKWISVSRVLRGVCFVAEPCERSARRYQMSRMRDEHHMGSFLGRYPFGPKHFEGFPDFPVHPIVHPNSSAQSLTPLKRYRSQRLTRKLCRV